MTRRDVCRRWAPGSDARLASIAGAATDRIDNPMAASPHFPAKAKHAAFLNGGPSQVDTFDHRPALKKYHGKTAPFANLRTERKTGNVMDSPFTFRKYGQSGLEVSEIFPQLGGLIDDICVIRSMYTDRPNHEPSLLKMNCGTRFRRRWGHGSRWPRNRKPESHGFVTLCPATCLAPLWASGYLPGVYQGTYLNTSEQMSRS
jgi:hypothetical protein